MCGCGDQCTGPCPVSYQPTTTICPTPICYARCSNLSALANKTPPCANNAINKRGCHPPQCNGYDVGTRGARATVGVAIAHQGCACLTSRTPPPLTNMTGPLSGFIPGKLRSPLPGRGSLRGLWLQRQEEIHRCRYRSFTNAHRFQMCVPGALGALPGRRRPSCRTSGYWLWHCGWP